MNKKEFINEVSKRCVVPQYVVNEIFNISSNIVIETLSTGKQVEIPKIGKFVLKERKAAIYHNLYGNKDKETKIGKIVYPLFQINNTIKTKIKREFTLELQNTQKTP